MWITSASPIRLLKAGDSITFGQGSATLNGYRLDVVRAITANRPVICLGSDATAVGTMADYMAGGVGKQTDEILTSLQTDVPRWKPGIVTIMAGTNDATRRAAGTGTPPTQAQSVANVSAMIDLAQGVGAKVVVCCPLVPNVDSAANTAIQAQDTAMLTMINAHPWTVAGNVAKADCRAAITAISSWQSAAMTDNTHPNDTGYAALGTAIGTAAALLL